MSINSETVLVTGASSGIGRELARSFASEGSGLVLVARNTGALLTLADELRREHKVKVTVLTADLAEPGSPLKIFNELHASGIAVDVLVNNAGFGAHGPFAELPLERQLEMIQVNITALTHLTGLFLPAIIKRRRGGVLNVASTAAFQPGPGMAVYYASKAYVLSFSEAIAEELAGSGATVTALCPGPTANTNFGTTARFQGPAILTQGALSAETVARCGHQAFRRGRFVVIPGARNSLLALAVRFMPRLVVRKFVKAVMGMRAKH